VLPVVAAWVGTLMAFYFGKENFKAATDSVSQIARQLTSQEKLGQTNVQKIGKPMEAVAPLRFDETDKLESVTLDKLEEKMRAKALRRAGGNFSGRMCRGAVRSIRHRLLSGRLLSDVLVRLLR
jgi:hypothetical protein